MSVSGFISRAACRGHRPHHLASLVSHGRPALVGQLLKNRAVARFIVAPSGYGKSSLAAEYAETVHAWAHTFWVNAQSPCFVRDLDAGVFATGLRAFDPDVSLVVIDDVPELEPERQERLSSEIDGLIAQGTEILVTCVPSCDAIGSLQRDRLRVGAGALLLDDDEVDACRTADERARKPVDQVGPAQRVPMLVWGVDDDRHARFAAGALEEDLPFDLLLVISTALVFQEGRVADLSDFTRLDGQALEDVAREYPHLGFDADLDRFEAPRIGMAALAPALKRRLSGLASHARFGSQVKLVCAWATALVRNGRPSRACELMRALCPRRRRAKWVFGNAPDLVRQACFFPLFGLIADRDEVDAEARAALDVLEALCRRVLGDEPGALRCAKRNAFDDEAAVPVRVLSQLLVAMLGDSEVADRALGELHARSEAAAGLGVAERSKWDLIAQAWDASTRGIAEMCRCWDELADADADADVRCLATSWLFGLCEGSDAELAADTSRVRLAAERYVREQLTDGVGGGRPDYLAASAGLSMEAAHLRGMEYGEGPLAAGSLILLRRMEMEVLSQRRLFEEDRELEQVRRADWMATHHTVDFSGGDFRQGSPKHPVPLLTLRLFGCFEAAIGGVPVDYSVFKRQQARALLVLLAVNQGRELSREVVSEAMWPQSPEEIAHKNFYTVWSSLRRVLSLPDGTCPYLIRHRHGCSLDARYVQSDVARLNDICRELLFGTPNIERWSTLFSEIDRDFSSDLMPSETKNALVIQARNDYRTRLVDALVAATVSVIGTENTQWGVWLARAAIGRDQTREDAYFALMRAQIAVNQRTAAMMTYLQCRRALSDQLGIDPSPETTALYESLLDT